MRNKRYLWFGLTGVLCLGLLSVILVNCVTQANSGPDDEWSGTHQFFFGDSRGYGKDGDCRYWVTDRSGDGLHFLDRKRARFLLRDLQYYRMKGDWFYALGWDGRQPPPGPRTSSLTAGMTYFILDAKTGYYDKYQRREAIPKRRLAEVRKLERQFEESTQHRSWWESLFPPSDT